MDLLRGPRLLAEALGLLRARRELWPLCVGPFAINLAIFGLAAWALVANLDALSAWLGSGLSLADPQAWYQWIWVGPVRALAWLLRWLLLLVFLIAGYFLFTVIGALIAAPFLDLLSERVERIRSGADPPSAGSGIGPALRAALRSSPSSCSR